MINHSRFKSVNKGKISNEDGCGTDKKQKELLETKFHKFWKIGIGGQSSHSHLKDYKQGGKTNLPIFLYTVWF